MRGLPEEQPVLSQSREEAACVSEEGQSFRGRKRGRRNVNGDKFQSGKTLYSQRNRIKRSTIDKIGTKSIYWIKFEGQPL